MAKPIFHQSMRVTVLCLVTLLFGSQAALSQQTSDTPLMPPVESSPVTEQELPRPDEIDSLAGSDAGHIETNTRALLPLRSESAARFVLASRASDEAKPFFKLVDNRYAGHSTTNAQNAQGGNTLVPLTAEEKLKFGFRSAFLNPTSYAFTAINAAITEASEDDQPQKTTEDRVADGLSRFARSFSTRGIKSILGSGVYPALLKQDPRYQPSGKKGFSPRAAYAISRIFVIKGDNGNDQPNISRLGGTLSASALANIYERSTPGHDRIGVGPTFKRFGTSIAFDMIQFVVFREFSPEIKKLFKR
ncbi:MAG: hypothetical protein M3Q76_09120 [Acidobacteriota bacterium]|nr:hypothetical protein [Acidobacteriota bacterium]